MNQVIDELKSIPGVIGGFVYDSQKGILANNLPSVFKVPKLEKLGKNLEKIYQNAGKNFSDIMEISLYYEESVLIVRKTVTDVYIVIMGDPSLNINLLTMSLNLVMEEPDAFSEPDIQVEKSFESEVSDETEEKKVNAEDLIASGHLAPTLQGMQSCLARIMGPMAEFIFKDAVQEWLKKNKPEKSNLQSLINLINDEIGDPEKILHYKALITPYIQMDEF